MDFVTVCLIASAAISGYAYPALSGESCRFFDLFSKAVWCVKQPKLDLPTNATVSPSDVLRLIADTCRAAIGGYAYPALSGESCRFFDLLSKAIGCVKQPKLDLPINVTVSPSDVLRLVADTCRRRPEERACMTIESAKCPSSETMLSSWEDSFNFCEDDAPSDWITNYATLSSGTVSPNCFNVFESATKICASRSMETYSHPDTNTTLQEGISVFRRLTRNAYECATETNAEIVSSRSECTDASQTDLVFITLLHLMTAPGEGFILRLPNDKMLSLKQLTIPGW